MRGPAPGPGDEPRREGPGRAGRGRVNSSGGEEARPDGIGSTREVRPGPCRAKASARAFGCDVWSWRGQVEHRTRPPPTCRGAIRERRLDGTGTRPFHAPAAPRGAAPGTAVRPPIQCRSALSSPVRPEPAGGVEPAALSSGSQAGRLRRRFRASCRERISRHPHPPLHRTCRRGRGGRRDARPRLDLSPAVRVDDDTLAGADVSSGPHDVTPRSIRRGRPGRRWSRPRRARSWWCSSVPPGLMVRRARRGP
jgi:hypothetical protein